MQTMPREPRIGERSLGQSGMSPRPHTMQEDPTSPPQSQNRSPRSSKSTPRQLRPLHTAGSCSNPNLFDRISGFSSSEDLSEPIEDTRRRYHFDRTTVMRVDATGSPRKSIDCAKSEFGVLQQLQFTGLKNFDVLLPSGTKSDSRSEQRDYLRLYYSDYIGQRPAMTPPFPADAESWDVEVLREFLVTSRPRTRIDAYPLLVITQDVLRKLAEREIKLVNSKTDELTKDLASTTNELNLVKSQRMELEALLEAQKDNFQAVHKDTQSKIQLQKISSIMQRGMMSNAQDKTSEKMKKLRQEIVDLQANIKSLNSQIEQKDSLLKKADSNFETHLKHLASKKPLDIFLSWQIADRKAIISFALSDPACLQSIGGIDKCLECLSKTSDPQMVLKMILRREFSAANSKEEFQRILKAELSNHVPQSDAEVQTEHFKTLPDLPAEAPSNTDEEDIPPTDDAAAPAEANLAVQLVESMTDINSELDQRLDTALTLNDDFNTEELSSELKIIKGLVRKLSKKFAQMEILLPKDSFGGDSSQKADDDDKSSKEDTSGTNTDSNVNGEHQEAQPCDAKPQISGEAVELGLQPSAGDSSSPTSKKIPVSFANVRLHEVTAAKNVLSKDSKPMMIDQCLRVIHEAYQSKLIQDVKDDAGTNRKRQPFDSYFKDFLVRKFGLRSIATKQLCSIALCIERDASKNARIRCFGELAGFIEGKSWTQMISDFALGILNRVCDFEGRELASVNEWLDSSTEPGITVQAAVHALKDMSLSSPIPFKEVDVNGICALPKNSNGNIIIEQLLLWCIEFFRKMQIIRKADFEGLFEANDKNGDGVLDFQEFEALIKLVVQSDTSLVLDKRDISQMYQEALRDDHQGTNSDCMSKEAFSDLAMRRGFKYTSR